MSSQLFVCYVRESKAPILSTFKLKCRLYLSINHIDDQADRLWNPHQRFMWYQRIHA